MANRLRALALAPYPREAASTRFRISQFVEPLGRRGIELRVRPMIDSATFRALYLPSRTPRAAAGLVEGSLRRVADLVRAARADVVFIQREAVLFGPPIVEWLVRHATRRPLVLDLDDPTWVGYDSPAYGRVGRLRKWPGKTNRLIGMASIVTCGSRMIADHVTGLGRRSVLVPSVVDTQRFIPVPTDADAEPVIGWVGSHSTTPYLEQVFPVLEDLARTRRFRLRLVGTRRMTRVPAGVVVEQHPWSIEREVSDFQAINVGLYPLPQDDLWARGKSGLKSVQYMAVGRPFVASNVGGVPEIGIPGQTHLVASTPDEWHRCLSQLIDDASLRRSMGEAGRAYVLEHRTVDRAADAMASALLEAAR